MQLIDIEDLTKDKILAILAQAALYKQQPESQVLANKIIAMCFFEPSTRTRLSFETAVLRLGGQVIGFSDTASTSSKKGESLEDSIKVISSYADVIVLRHPEVGAAKRAAAVSNVPIINAGDGANQHPSQTLLDLFSMQECFENLEGLHVGMLGDLRYGRTVHSLAKAGALFQQKFSFIAPKELSMPAEICADLDKQNLSYQHVVDLSSVISDLDVLYVTRLQKERLPADFSGSANYRVDAKILRKAKPGLRVLHPLPRVDELATDVDGLPQAYYFQQAENGVYVREAILTC